MSSNRLLLTIDKQFPLSYDNLHRENKTEDGELKVNPDSIKSGDIISTKLGVARVIFVSNEKGVLSYAPLNDPSCVLYNETVPIRSISLLASYTEKGQLEFSFVAEEIERAIKERNIRLDKMKAEKIEEGYRKQEAKSKKRKYGGKSKKIKSKEETEMEELVKLAGGVDNLNKLLGGGD